MSRSRPARTVEFAPDYAAAATNPRAAQGWYARGKEAGRYLAALDVELTAERDGIAARLVRAAALEAEAAVLLAARRPDRAMSAERMGVVSPGDPHRAVDLIARALLLLDEADGRLFVDPRDDPDGLVTGVDLAGVQRRLAGIRASQQRELAQVQAFARRHGAEALFDDTCETHSAWFRDAVARWRDAPVMQRYLADRERQVTAERARDAGARQVQQHRRADRQRMLEEAADLRSLADIPFLGDLAGNDSRGVTPSRAERAVQPAPVQPAAPRQPALVWSDVERRHRELLIWRQERERQRVRQAVTQALADRVGTPQAPTPYAARLLAKLRDGFDPAGLPDKVGATGRTLDQRDAAEIALLSRDPGFRAQMEAARQRAPLPSPMPVTTGPDFLGRVGLVRGRLHFGPVPPDHPGPLRTPLEWAEQTVALVLARRIPLTRQDGLVGLHDADVLRLSHDNYLGLLHPAVQHVLDATFRVQAEEERGVLARIRSGDLKVETTIGEDRLSREVRTQVQLTGGEAEEQAFVAQRRSDPTFYFRCREAAAGIADDPPTLRAAHAAVRAWLAARDEDAAPPVLERLGQAVRRIGSDALTAGMADADARALTRLLAPTPPAGPTTRRKGRARSHLPLHPGRSGLSR